MQTRLREGGGARVEPRRGRSLSHKMWSQGSGSSNPYSRRAMELQTPKRGSEGAAAGRGIAMGVVERAGSGEKGGVPPSSGSEESAAVEVALVCELEPAVELSPRSPAIFLSSFLRCPSLEIPIVFMSSSESSNNSEPAIEFSANASRNSPSSMLSNQAAHSFTDHWTGSVRAQRRHDATVGRANRSQQRAAGQMVLGRG